MPTTSETRFLIPAFLAGVLTLVAAVRIMATYPVYSGTFDEPSHVAAGMEWIDRQQFTYEPMNPPLARIATATGLYLGGIRSFGSEHRWREGRNILYARGTYARNLSLARVGILPFFLLGAAIVWLWAGRLFGPATAAVAVLLFVTLPPVLGHAGVATTDLPLATTVLGALYALFLWLEARTLRRTLLVGTALALATLTKFSALLFLPAAAAAVFAARWLAREPKPEGETPHTLGTVPALLFGAGVAGFFVWAGYLYSFGPVGDGGSVPAPEFWIGLSELINKNRIGHEAFLFGEISTHGWWYFFPVTLAVKTPIAFGVLTVIGSVAAIRRLRDNHDWRPVAPLAAATAIVLVSLPSNLNIGVRHVLPVYPLAAIVAAHGIGVMWQTANWRIIGRAAVIPLVAWQVVATWRAHPDYLPWFNELAGARADRILVNSDLDWGQDLLRLADTVQSRGIDSLALAYFGSADPRAHFRNVRPIAPFERPVGWFAVSVAVIKGLNVPDHTGFEWLEEVTPVVQVGRSIRLYYTEPEPEAEADPGDVEGDEEAMQADTGQ